MANWLFRGPAVRLVETPFAEPGGVTGPRMPRDVGLTVYRLAGLWRQAQYVSVSDAAASDRLYPGGRVHTVAQAAADELTAAGYGAYLTVLP